MNAGEFVDRHETELLNANEAEFVPVRNRIMRDARMQFNHSLAREIDDALPDTYNQAQGLANQKKATA